MKRSWSWSPKDDTSPHKSPTPPESSSPEARYSPVGQMYFDEPPTPAAVDTFRPWDHSGENHQNPSVSTKVPAVERDQPLKAYQHFKISTADIRLLRLGPGKGDEPLRCSLKRVNMNRISRLQISSPYKYQALSYAWGTDEPTFTVYVNKDPTPIRADYSFRKPVEQSIKDGSCQPFKIRANLFRALTRLRSNTDGVWLWADAICIDQKDEEEKNHQLPKMPDIFSNAWSVTIWIGEDHKSSTETLAMKFIPSILNLKLLDRLVASGPPDEEPLRLWAAFASLLKRPWFTRRWVIQEVAFAKRAALRCGSNIISWADFADAVELFFRKLERIRSLYDASELSKKDPDALSHVESAGAQALLQASNGVFRKDQKENVLDRFWKLEALVTKFTSFETADPRDTVYALLSLASDVDLSSRGTSGKEEKGEESKTLKPEYHKHPLDVFIEFVRYCVDATQSLDVICRHWAPNIKGNGMPSWVGLVDHSPFGPPSRFTGRINGDSFVGEAGHRIYNASKWIEANATFGSAENPNSTSTLSDNAELTAHNTMDQQTSDAKEKPPNKKQKLDDNSLHSLNNRREENGRNHDVTQPGLGIQRCFNGSLVVKGMVLQRIDRVSPRVVDGTISDECLDILGWQQNQDVNQISDQLWRTLVADRGPDGKNAPTWYKRACAFSLLKTSAEGDLNTSKLIASATLPESVVEYLKRVQAIVWSRKFFQCGGETKSSSDENTSKLVGLGSRHIREGDLVCILFGCSVPVILREIRGCSDRAYYVKMMSECFVYGKMDGEALAALKPKEIEDRTVSFEIW